MALIGILGIVAGILTTIAGAGGGVLLIVSLSLVLGPHVALAATAPALLVGNLHRLVLYRKSVDRRIALPVIAGAVPASLAAGALTMSLPKTAIEGLFLAITAYAVARACGAPSWAPPRAFLAPAGAVVGSVSATSGGAGLLMSPLLLSSGLTGRRYVATSAAVALCTHAGRLTGYWSRGMMSRDVLGYAAVAAVTVVLGNHLGDQVRPYLEKRATFVEHGTLAVCAVLEIVGLHG